MLGKNKPTNWEDQIEIPKKGENIACAFIVDSSEKQKECSPEELIEAIETKDDIKFITYPNQKQFFIPGFDYRSLKLLLKKEKESSKSSIKRSALFVILWAGFMLLISQREMNSFFSDPMSNLYFLILGILPLLRGIYELISHLAINETNYHQEFSEIKFRFWLGQKKTVSIFIVCGFLVLIILFQYIFGINESVKLAGLVKPQTLNGEYWRLLTATLLHANFIHFFFNVSALYIFGHFVIRISGFSYFVIVFLFSCLFGSLFSLFLIPNLTSVGASGGIMGLIGFILIMSIKFKNNIPKNYIKHMISDIIAVAIFGYFGREFIDNPAHAGGLIGGMLIGIISVRNRNNLIPHKPSLAIKILGIASSLILLAAVTRVLILFI